MTEAVTAAAVAAGPPTLAALLAYANARAARREAKHGDTTALVGAVEALGASARRTEAGLSRVEGGVGELRERVARIEGALSEWAPWR
jgi:hypothetical protein